MKTDIEEMAEMMEQMAEMVDPTIKLTQVFYERMADNAALLKGVAKFHSRLVASLVEEGFTREEAINMAIHAMTTLGGNKK